MDTLDMAALPVERQAGDKFFDFKRKREEWSGATTYSLIVGRTELILSVRRRPKE